MQTQATPVYKRFSYSKLSTYLSCPLRFKYQYVDKITTEVPIPYVTILGTAVHKVLEHFYQETQYSDDKIEQLWDWVCNNIDEKGFPPVLKDTRTEFYGNEDKSRMFFFHGRKILTSFYHKNKWIFLHPEYSFLEAEKPFQITFHDWTLTGVIDKIESHTKEKRVFICDYKAGSKVPTLEEIEKSIQATFYSLAYRQLYKKEERGLYFHYLRENIMLKTKRSEEHYNELYNTLKLVTEKIKANEYTATPSKSACQFCQYQNICEAKKGIKE